MDSKQRRQVRKAEKKAREEAFESLDNPSKEAQWVHEQWALLDAREVDLNVKEIGLVQMEEALRKNWKNLSNIVEVEAETMAKQMVDKLNEPVAKRLSELEASLEARQKELSDREDEVGSALETAKNAKRSFDGALQTQIHLNAKLAEQIAQVANIDLLKEVLMDLELDEHPGVIATKIRQRFGLLIAQW